METMKDSGLKWIGAIPSDWKVTRIKYMSSLKGRIGWQGLTSEEYQDEGAYLITGIDFLDGGIDWENCVHVPMKRWEEAKDIQIQNGDLLITKDGTIGKVAIVSDMPGETSLNSGVLRIMPFEGYSRRFLYWVLQSDEFWNWFNYKNAGNSTIVHLYQGDFAEFYYTFPDYKEQERIADYLDSHCAKLDKIIANLERQIELLQKYKKSLITETVTKGLDKNVEMKNTGIDCIKWIPKHWEVSKVKYLVDDSSVYPIGDGDHGLIQSDDYLPEGIPYLRVLNLTFGDGLNLDGLVYISDSMNAKIKNSQLKPGDLLIAKTGATIGKTAIVPEDIPISNTTSHVGKITLPDNRDAKYFYYVLTSTVVQDQIQDMSAMQSTRPELGIEGIKNLRVVVPPIEEQKQISTYLDKATGKIDAVVKGKRDQLDKIIMAKTATIYEYVTGKKRVKEVV
jgi:type I restriction enzyme S subunit